MLLDILNPAALPPDAERRLHDKHEALMAQLASAMGPMLAVWVLTFAIWDYFVDPAHVLWTLPIRVFFVALSALGYREGILPLSASGRCVYVHWMFSAAIILSEFMLVDGFRYGLVGVVSGVFFVALIAQNNVSFLLAVSAPFALFLVCAALVRPLPELANDVVFYLLTMAIAYVMMAMIRFLRHSEARLEEELLQQATHDSLTGLYNRGRLNELAVREMSVARRHRRALAVLMLDIDRFKLVNDTYGHDVGDRVIRRLADACRAQVREIDHVGRFGGEEFVCLLPETDRDAAVACAERLRTTIESLRVESPLGEVRFTVSIGVALYDDAYAGWEELLKDADAALYRAKQEGRNRVVLAARPAPDAMQAG
ncbi:MAG TPA: GGDEF domain-containing protein [Noviherbaspirillum sp.]|nr:GGDEF domain-containing protein [Noviherbaspirillum sp.]